MFLIHFPDRCSLKYSLEYFILLYKNTVTSFFTAVLGRGHNKCVYTVYPPFISVHVSRQTTRGSTKKNRQHALLTAESQVTSRCVQLVCRWAVWDMHVKESPNLLLRGVVFFTFAITFLVDSMLHKELKSAVFTTINSLFKESRFHYCKQSSKPRRVQRCWNEWYT